MARPMTALVVFFIALNLFSGALISTGVADTLGLDADVGADAAVDERTGSRSVGTGSATGETLFGSYNVLSGQLLDFFEVVFPGLAMLSRAGVPDAITNGILGPLFSVMIFIGVVSFFRGWSL